MNTLLARLGPICCTSSGTYTVQHKNPKVKKRTALDENKESRRNHSKKKKGETVFFLSLKKRKGKKRKIKESTEDADG
jgi:hypothetical protein